MPQSSANGGRDLAHHHLPLARRLAAHYRRSTHAHQDVERVAVAGLSKAIDSHSPGDGPLLPYAIETISGELKRYLSDGGGRAQGQRDLGERVRRATDELTASLGQCPTPTRVAEETGLPLDEVIEALQAEIGEPARGVAPDRGSLAPLEREVLCLRFVENVTQSEIGRRVGVSQMQVSRTLRRSLSQLQRSRSRRQQAGSTA